MNKLYNELVDQKRKNKLYSFDELTASNLEQLFLKENISDRMIAELFGVSRGQVTYRRRKHGINLRKESINVSFENENEDIKEFNDNYKDKVFTKENLRKMAIALTHFAFRKGPIEDMHAAPNNQLSNDDMEVLNKFMVNRLAYVLELILDEKWIEFNILIEHYGLYGSDWDEPIPDDDGIRETIGKLLK